MSVICFHDILSLLVHYNVLIFTLQVSLIESLNESMESLHNKLNKQAGEIAEMRLKLQSVEGTDRDVTQPSAMLFSPPAVESLPVTPLPSRPNVLPSPVSEQGSNTGNL